MGYGITTYADHILPAKPTKPDTIKTDTLKPAVAAIPASSTNLPVSPIKPF